MSESLPIVGHERPIKVLLRAMAAGRTAHAYLFWGPDGCGKERVARLAAQLLLCRDGEALKRGAPCGHCDACAKMKGEGHPDLHLLSPGDKAISVEEVRRLQETLSFQSFERGRKIAIIRDSFRMSREGANALLKTVEEPPPETHLFLLAHHRSQLLPTLVSRCQPLRFDPLSEGEVEEVLLSKGVEAAEANMLASLSGGSVAMALGHDMESLLEARDEAERVAKSLAEISPAERLELSERWSKDKESLPLRLDCLERSLRSRQADDLFALDTMGRLFTVRALIERNVNLQLALDALFLLEDEGGWEEIV